MGSSWNETVCFKPSSYSRMFTVFNGKLSRNICIYRENYRRMDGIGLVSIGLFENCRLWTPTISLDRYIYHFFKILTTVPYSTIRFRSVRAKGKVGLYVRWCPNGILEWLTGSGGRVTSPRSNRKRPDRRLLICWLMHLC